METETKNRKIALYTFLELIALLILTMLASMWDWVNMGFTLSKITTKAYWNDVILISFGGKAIKSLLGFLPRDTQKQQIVRYTIELIFGLIIPALCLWGIHLFKTNVELACKTAYECIISVMVAIVINNMFFKTLIYQWQCMAEVSHNKKIKRMEQAQQ